MSSCFVTDCVALSEIQTKSGRKSRFEGLAYSIRSRGCASTTSTRWHQMNELPDADFGLLRPDVMRSEKPAGRADLKALHIQYDHAVVQAQHPRGGTK